MDPPRGLSAHKLLAGASLLAEAGADVINVADSPMARMRMSPWAVCDLVQRQVGVDTVLHFPDPRPQPAARPGRPAGGPRPGDSQCLRGHGRSHRHRRLSRRHGQLRPGALRPDQADQAELQPGLDHAGADIGQPTAFFVGCALNLCPPDPAQEIKNLRRKIKAGADFLLTQPVFEPQLAEAFLQALRRPAWPAELPILVGVLPLYGLRHATFLHNEVPGISISDESRSACASAGDDAP